MSTPKLYEATYLPDAEIILGGELAGAAWDRANVESGFCFPWEHRAVPHTEFRAIFDAQALYFAFRVQDHDIVLAENFRSKQDVVYEDRVELFFALDEELAQYFCVEIDPLGRVLDYRASHYRQLDFSWSFPGLETAGEETSEGYAVQGRIPWASFAALGFPPPDSGRAMKFGIYRAEFSHTQGRDWSESWISWVDPQTAEPDFHVAESFGYLKFVS